MIKDRWSQNVMRVYQKYPAAFRSSKWDEIVLLANADRMVDALLLAADHEDKKKSHRAENVIARRIRIQRVALFKLQRDHLEKIKEVFETASLALANRMVHLPNTVSSIAPMRQRTRAIIVDLRRALNKIVTDLIWQSILLGVKNMGEAIKPILRDNAESFVEELADVKLLEARLTVGMDKKLARKTDGTVDLGSAKWEKIVDGIYSDMVKSNLNGQTISERIWDMTDTAEKQLRRIVATEIARGTSSRDIADRIQQYVFTKGIDDVQSGPGIYKSPLKNAMRLARTETNRAYTQASAAWAENKPWVKAIRVTLSPAHKVEDDCDDVAGNEYSPEEFVGVVPVHPHCMCFGTYVIDEDYLTNNVPGKEEDDK